MRLMAFVNLKIDRTDNFEQEEKDHRLKYKERSGRRDRTHCYHVQLMLENCVQDRGIPLLDLWYDTILRKSKLAKGVPSSPNCWRSSEDVR